MSSLLALGEQILARQPFNTLIGARLVELSAGVAKLHLEIRTHHLQQQGVVHGGVIGYLIDNCITFCGGTVLGSNVMTAEFKVNYIRSARSGLLVATASILGRSGRTAVCLCEVNALEGDETMLCAVGSGSIMSVSGA
jgi:uncharacterized protein (TIGR00369 family)